jgi:multiple sugar transport system permease protein/alpha-1,4-digalacturonate transport system permease protein
VARQPAGGERDVTVSRPRLGDSVCCLALIAGAVIMVFPIYWMFATSVRPHAEIFEAVARLLPSSLSRNNFRTVLTRYPVLAWLDNSVIIAVVAVALTVFINLLCGYTFAKFRFPGRNILFFAILGALMVPIQVILVPEFLIVSWLGLLNTHLGVILPRAAEAFGIFMVRQFMVSIPDELIEAARLDGAGEFAIFFRIVLPLSKPIIAVLVIFTFMWRWNDFAWPLVALTNQDMFTVPLGLNLLRGEVNPNWGNVMALALLSLLPMLAIFLAFQRYLVQGIASTGLR